MTLITGSAAAALPPTGTAGTTSADASLTALSRSRSFCEHLTRRAAKNFYYGLKLLPEPKRSHMYALYAYMRLLDDIADEDDGRTVGQRVDDLDGWRRLTHDVLDGRLPDGPPEDGGRNV